MELVGNFAETEETVGGNTNTPTLTLEKGIKETKEIKKRIVPSKYWCFTSFGDEIELMENALIEDDNIKYIIGHETCPNTGKKHLQGYLESKTKIRPVEKFKTKTTHWEKTKGTREENIKYCSKEKDYESNFDIKTYVDPMEGLTWYDWQIKLNTILNDKPDKRDIHWLYETQGNMGKTTFCKHLCIKYDAIYVCGKASDVKCGIVDWHKNKKSWPKIVLWDLPREKSDYVSYASLEEVKNGIFFSGKYESGMAIFDPPHVVVFANFEPDTKKMSLDRWQIKNIGINKCPFTDSEHTYPDVQLINHEPTILDDQSINQLMAERE